ncbi:133aa long hypothetical protein [Pyrococcus horikoshii OT3]|uniref:Uncharacterized protein n=1 Tax=Pyrococcus horikoshii (strain ATCC 700860 / DSM 12428 / JCM 9974 / NBRC 100139 / OT-3) TaxID=70601 RepID=O58824_PYRHO|nr:133aa long hypothetical protein [Pyrococcus horikoshii OT3]
MFIRNGSSSSITQPLILSILLAATTNGVLYLLNISMLSIVCGWKPSFTSITRTAKSAKLPPLALRLVKASCPGVSMKSKPGSLISAFQSLIRGPAIFLTTSIGTSVAPMCCVIPPASLAATFVFLILSSRVVL